MVGFAILPATIIGGLLWDRVSQPAAFWFGALCVAGAIVLLTLVRRPAKPRRAATTTPVFMLVSLTWTRCAVPIA